MDKESRATENSDSSGQNDTKVELPFKKPTLLIGKIGRLPRKVQPSIASNIANTEKVLNTTNEEKSISNFENSSSNLALQDRESADKQQETLNSPAQQQAENAILLPYKEPSWSGLPETSGRPYAFEVLKNGSIIETVGLMKKSFWVFGRLANCDICMQHPTISRYHAVIQYRDAPSDSDPPGFYIYDLGSTHGTFLNGKNKLKPKIYVPVRVGHIIRLGCSQRSYILVGPEDDQEDESELSVTELKQLKEQKKRDYEEKMRKEELEREERRKREEERGVDWGMGDDADIEEDIGENPFASTNNEDLYLDDPKKALRGFFEREGLEFEYDCTEQGMGQFLCKVELPLDDEMGRPIVAEALHRGKKKEAVVHCALEACRILDRYGVLRQATHESKKRKTRNWEENDYYDSDEDTFLDRTGTIEQKREKRMKVKEPEKAETYEGLIEKEKQIAKSIGEIERKLGKAQSKLDDSNSRSNTEEDSLDSYMKGLSDDRPDKQTISKLKLELASLRKNHANVIRLANIAKPANLPPLMPSSSSSASTSGSSKRSLPIFGKRKTVPVRFPSKPDPKSTVLSETPHTSEDLVEEESDDEAESVPNFQELVKPNLSGGLMDTNTPTESHENPVCLVEHVSNIEDCGVGSSIKETHFPRTDQSSNDPNSDSGMPENNPSQDNIPSDSDSSDDEPPDVQIPEEFRPIKTFHDTQTFKKFEKIMKTGLPAVADKHKQKLVKILRKLQRMASNEDRMHSDWKILSAKKRKVLKWISELRQSESNEKLEFRVSTELNRILSELNTMTEDKFKVIGQVRQMGHDLKTISVEIDNDIQELKKGMHCEKACTSKACFNNPERGNSSSEAEDPSSPRPASSKSPANNLEQGNSSLETGSIKNPEDDSEETDDKKKKKNQKRTELRQHKAELERQRGYEEDASREDYNMWVPPTDQSGDGRTSLNEKYGY